jgi:hypothetical protein
MSSAVYSGLTENPSGVFQLRALTSPPGADLAADLCQASRLVGLKGEWAAGGGEDTGEVAEVEEEEEEEGAVLSELMTKSD